jgi:hypothetical protein
VAHYQLCKAHTLSFSGVKVTNSILTNVSLQFLLVVVPSVSHRFAVKCCLSTLGRLSFPNSFSAAPRPLTAVCKMPPKTKKGKGLRVHKLPKKPKRVIVTESESESESEKEIAVPRHKVATRKVAARKGERPGFATALTKLAKMAANSTMDVTARIAGVVGSQETPPPRATKTTLQKLPPEFNKLEPRKFHDRYTAFLVYNDGLNGTSYGAQSGAMKDAQGNPYKHRRVDSNKARKIYEGTRKLMQNVNGDALRNY